MAYEFIKEGLSFWKVWKSGTHATILAEILSSDEFHELAKVNIVDPAKQIDLVKAVVRMTGRRIGQEIARKAGALQVERDVDNDLGSVYSAMPAGTADDIATQMMSNPTISDILSSSVGLQDEDDIRAKVNELTFYASRMTGRALGKKLGLSVPKNLGEVASKLVSLLGIL